jgi:hypothetical protein
MSVRDVRHLVAAEGRGEQVASWYCKAVWDRRKGSVVDEETALRLSKLLRDNRHTLMRVLERIADAGHFAFLATFLGLDCAKHDVEFVNLRVENHLTLFDQLVHSARTTKYAVEQQARRLRVAFDALRDYIGKENRNAFVISNDRIEEAIRNAICELDAAPDRERRLDEELRNVLSAEVPSDEELRYVVVKVPSVQNEPAEFARARAALQQAMDLVAEELSVLWDDERYVRAPLDEEAEEEAEPQAEED